MSETMDPMTTEMEQHELAQQLLAQARVQGIELAAPSPPDRSRRNDGLSCPSRFPPTMSACFQVPSISSNFR